MVDSLFAQWRRQKRRQRMVTITRLILEKLAEIGEGTVGSFFPAKYPEARLWRELLGFSPSYHFKRETFSSLLSRLHAQGLVERSGSRPKSLWRMTRLGSSYVKKRRDGAMTQKPDGRRRLVIFDIPEKERAKRHAIRTELIAGGFVPLQKSVWYGERKLPSDFIALVGELRLKPHIHIFSVEKEGTLPPVILTNRNGRPVLV